MTPREYNLYLTRSQKLAAGLPLLVLTAFLVILVATFGRADFIASKGDVPPFFPALPLLFFFGFGALYMWSVLSLPYRISVTHDRQLVFKSIVRSRQVRVSDVLSIEPRNLHIQAGVSGYLLKHKNGKLLFPGQFTEQYLLLHELKQANPKVDLLGC